MQQCFKVQNVKEKFQGVIIQQSQNCSRDTKNYGPSDYHAQHGYNA